ncbi:hypothetical protein rsdtw13_36400 [Clostridium sp. TW13]|uniref:Uncharacterized protein n=1 Tax=Inconstantimicrobium mannanitabidum TaxID=1604901 RepID=A0ACB5RH26_9CLOT|nr:hypothetical protein rsdtw13_36400 [Clostridium sp. TW13]
MKINITRYLIVIIKNFNIVNVKYIINFGIGNEKIFYNVSIFEIYNKLFLIYNYMMRGVFK